MKIFFSLLLVVFISFNSSATQQTPDSLIYEGKQLALSTSWAYPSPLETYFHYNNQKSIFKNGGITSTANYRGHLAYWLIENGKLFLSEVRSGRETQHPSFYGIKSIQHKPSTNGAIAADWFSGVIAADYYEEIESSRSYQATYYFQIRNGQVVAKNDIAAEELKAIRESTKETASAYLKLKMEFAELFEDYTDYYFRLNKEDSIELDQKKGLLRSKRQQSPLLGYFNNDHLEWPYNWENRKVNGAPNCKWIVKNNRIYLTDVDLHSGSNLYSVESQKVELTDIFQDPMADKEVFAEWMTGLYLIVYGQVDETESQEEYSNFIESDYTFLRVKNGIVQERHQFDADTDINNATEALAQLFEEWKAY